MQVTLAGAVFMLAAAYFFLRGPHALFAGLLFGAAFPATAVLVVPRYDFGVQPFHLFALLYWLRVGVDRLVIHLRRGKGSHAPWGIARGDGSVRSSWLLIAFSLLWCGTATLGSLLGRDQGIPIVASVDENPLLRTVEVLEPTKRFFHLAYLYLMVAVAWAAYSEALTLSVGERGFSLSSSRGAPTANVVLQRLLRPWLWGALAGAAWGVWQVVAYYLHLPYPLVFHNNPTCLQLYQATAGPLKQMSGTFPEPSMLGMYMVGSAFLSLQWPGTVVPVVLAVSGLLSLSTTSVAGVALGLVGAVVHVMTQSGDVVRVHRRAALALILALLLAIGTVGVLGALVRSMPPGLQNSWVSNAAVALYAQTLGKMSTSSGQLRYEAFMNGVKLWLQRPWLGWGAGTFRTPDMVSSTLANLGIVGMVLLSGIVLMAAWKAWSAGVHWVSLALMLFFALQSLAVPEINFPYLWVLVGSILGSCTDAEYSKQFRQWSRHDLVETTSR